MDTNNTLGKFFGGNKAQGGGQGAGAELANLSAIQGYYLHLMGSQLYYRVPVVSNLEAIDTGVVTEIAQFCGAVAPAVYQTWMQLEAALTAGSAQGGQHPYLRKTA